MNYLEQLKALREQRSALVSQITNAATNEALDKIELDIRKVDMQIAAVEERMHNEQGQQSGDGEGEDPASRSFDGGQQEQRSFNPLQSFRSAQQQNYEECEDVFGSLEYRQAFRNYVVSGTPIPEKFRTEERSAEMTVVGDVAAVIPTTIQNQVIEDLTVEGQIISRISQTSMQGGIQIPIAEINPEATWLESETSVSDEQKAKMDAKISFGYHLLEARVAVGILSATVSLPVFEATIVKNLKKAMIRAIEKSVVSGTGSGQPKGITKYTLPSEQVIEFTADQIGTVQGWARAEAAIPEAYEAGEIYMMSKSTWEMYLNGMVDKNGQKIGLGKINEKGQKILNGREVLTTDQLPSYDAAGNGAIFGVLVNLEEYLLNSNLAMYYKKYFDEDKNKWVHKALTIADGQMAIGNDSRGKLVGAKGLIYLKKKVGE